MCALVTGVQTCALPIYDKQSYGQGIASSVKSELEKAGVKVVMFEGINAGDSDYSAVITKLKSSDADFVYYGGYHPEMGRSEEHTSELQSLMRISYAVFCLKKKKTK